jgi:hypothetical protein
MYTQAQLKAAGLTDFRFFLAQVWAFLRLPKPTPVQRDIAYHLQHGPRRQIISAFRGVGKSWITVSFVLWLLLLNPEEKILVVSANQQLADDFSKFCKQLIQGMPLLQHLAAKPGQRDSAIKFDVGPARESKDPSVKSAGIDGQITGNRASVIVADDIEVPKNSYTHLLRERLAEKVKEFDAVLKPGGRVIYLGTPQLEDSLYKRLLDRGYEMLVWPIEIPEKPESYGGRLAKFVLDLIARGFQKGDSIEPGRFPQAELDERRLSYGRGGYALQFMLDTNPSDEERYPLKMRDALVIDVDDALGYLKLVWSSEPQYVVSELQCGGLDGDCWRRPAYKSDEMASWTGTVLAIDPSGQGKDETAYAIVRNLSGVLYVVASGGFKEGYGPATMEKLAALAARYGVNEVVVEKNFGGGMFTELLKPYLHRVGIGKIEEVWHTGMKEARIVDTLGPLLAAHKLVFDRKVVEEDKKQQADDHRYSLVWQLTRLAKLKGALSHDDRVEALYMACHHFAAKVARDQDKLVARAQQQEFDRQLAAFVESARRTGFQRQRPGRRVASGKRRR